MSLIKHLFGTILVVIAFSAHAANQNEIESKVAELNGHSIRILGVSLNALRFLVGASQYSYLLLSELERNGDINYIRELEKKGYVKAQITQGLPDGTEMSEEFMRVIPVGVGEEMQSCVLKLKHNIQVERTR